MGDASKETSSGIEEDVKAIKPGVANWKQSKIREGAVGKSQVITYPPVQVVGFPIGKAGKGS